MTPPNCLAIITYLGFLCYSVHALDPDTSWCNSKPHHNWHYQHDRYYTLLLDTPCRFPDCQAACQNNNGTLAFPHSKESFNTLLSFVNDFTGPAYVGIHLPLYFIPGANSACTASECDKKLVYSNFTSFKYEEWMNHQFDRSPNQPTCFKMVLDAQLKQTIVEPTHCEEPLMAVCESFCPRPGVPISPPPIEQQDAVPLEMQLIKLQVSRQRRQTSNNSATTIDQHFEELMQTPVSNVNLLDELPAFPTDPNYGAPATATNHDLVGYDCSVPRELTTVQMMHTENPCGYTPQPQMQKNATYLLLQKADRLPIITRKCKITQTTIPFYCGVWSHTVLSPDWLQIEENLFLTKQACESMWNTGTYRDPKGHKHKLELNGTTHIYFNTVGKTEHTQSGPTCVGEEYRHDGKTYVNMVITVSRKIELFQHMATVDDEEILHLPQIGITLPCPLSRLNCQTTQHGLFTWDHHTQDQLCPYYKTRQTSGIIVQDSQERSLYISTDNSMIRLLLKEPISRCGHIIYKTNYEKLFVSPDLEARKFQTNLPPTEMSVWTYANMQDSYMMGTLTRFIQQEFAAVHQHSCKSSITRDRFNYDRILAEQHGSTDGDTAALGGGYFLTVAGEAYYRYRCRRVIVRARATTTCYSSLPINLQREDYVRYLHDRRINDTTDLHFFLEPHSRHISTRGIKIPCSETFAPLYATAKNSWIRVDPIVTLTNQPEPLNLKTFLDLPLHDADDWDFEAGGIYTAEQIHHHDSHLGMARAVKDVQYTMGQKAITSGWSSSNRNHHFAFSPDQIIKTITGFNIWSFLYKCLKEWSFFCSLVFGTYSFVYILYWLFACVRTAMFPIEPPSTTISRFTNAIRRPDLPHRRHKRRQRHQNNDVYQVHYERIRDQDRQHQSSSTSPRLQRRKQRSPTLQFFPLRPSRSTPSLRYQPSAPIVRPQAVIRPQSLHQNETLNNPGTLRRQTYYQHTLPEPMTSPFNRRRQSPTAFQSLTRRTLTPTNNSRNNSPRTSPRNSPRTSPIQNRSPRSSPNGRRSPSKRSPRQSPRQSPMTENTPFNPIRSTTPPSSNTQPRQLYPMFEMATIRTESPRETGTRPKQQTQATINPPISYMDILKMPPAMKQQHILGSIDHLMKQVNQVVQSNPHLQQNCQVLQQNIDLMKRRILSVGLTVKEMNTVAHRLLDHQRQLNQMTPSTEPIYQQMANLPPNPNPLASIQETPID